VAATAVARAGRQANGVPALRSIQHRPRRRLPRAGRGLHRAGNWGTYATTAALVVEIVSPGDETWEKVPFYAAHDVDEVLIVDPTTCDVHWLALDHGSYEPVARSRLIDLGPADLVAQIDWQQVEPG
jgi:Uma2 family endonuclease